MKYSLILAFLLNRNERASTRLSIAKEIPQQELSPAESSSLHYLVHRMHVHLPYNDIFPLIINMFQGLIEFKLVNVFLLKAVKS